jgi:5,10-methylene-tetrahydrofolate dehydrogenase/methenyl tetrahydrofolate cyclohydrolase
MKTFNGKEIRDRILSQLKSKIEKMDQKPGLAVFCIGDNPVCSKYVTLKKKFADKIGINFFDFLNQTLFF